MHGGVDGYSFLQCSNTNEAAVVLQLLREAVNIYGLPSYICIDKGGENTDIAMFLLTHPFFSPTHYVVLDVVLLLQGKVCTTI